MAGDARTRWSFLHSLWAGILGISAEVMMTIAFIAAGFLVCLLLWGVTR